MVKLYGYELYKVVSRRLFWCLLTGALAVCAFLYGSGQSASLSREESYEVQALSESLMALPDGERTEKIAQELLETEIRRTVRSAGESEFGDIFLEYYRESYPELVAQIEAESDAADAEELRSDYLVWYELQTENENIVNYPAFIEAVQANAQRMASSTLFSKPGTFSRANVEKTAADYEGLGSRKLSLGLSKGVTSVTSFLAGDLIVLMLVLIMTVLVFFDEYRKGMLPVLRSCRNGRGAVIGSKLAAVCTLSLAAAGLYTGLMLGYGAYRYGFGDLGRALQSLPEFRDCTLKITVGGYLAAAFAVKAAVFLGAGLFFSLVFVLFQQNVATVLIVSLAPLVTALILYTFIRPSFILNHLKYINPFFWLDGTKLFGYYVNLNIVGVPIHALTCLPVAQSLIWVLCTLAACIRFVTDRAAAKKPLPERILEKASHRLRGRDKTAALFWNEGYKLMVQERLLILLVLVLGLSLYLVHGYHDLTFSEDDAVYRMYMKELSGEATEETWENYRAIAEEYETLDDQIEAIRQQKENGEITGLEMRGQIEYLQDTVGRRINAFAKVQQEAEYIAMLQEAGEPGWFVDSVSAAIILNSPKMELKYSMIYVAAAILCASGLYATEIKRDLLGLFQTTRRGRGSLTATKLIWMVLTVLVLYAAVFVPFWIYLYRNLGTLPLNAPMRCLQEYAGFSGGLTIGGALAIRCGWILLCGLAGACLTVALSLILYNRVTALVLGELVFALPLLLQWLGVDVSSFTAAAAPMVTETLKRPYAATVIGIGFSATVLLGELGICAILNRTVYGKQRRKPK
ncbi:MAG: hypothetical protein IKO00_09620 [Oscillospiraceae bacterium]|nr:hypothetical protein [Oscillospiraceae bacterium]